MSVANTEVLVEANANQPSNVFIRSIDTTKACDDWRLLNWCDRIARSVLATRFASIGRARGRFGSRANGWNIGSPANRRDASVFRATSETDLATSHSGGRRSAFQRLRNFAHQSTVACSPAPNRAALRGQHQVSPSATGLRAVRIKR
jgi:hypothetical protein